MFKYLKKPDVPSSSPDVITFPFDFQTFQFSMDNFVKSYTRKRVTKENLQEVMEEVNQTVRPDWSNFKLWDYISVLMMVGITGAIFYCIFTIKVRYLLLFAIKMFAILLGVIANLAIWACCLGSSINKIREKIQGVLDNRDEFYDEKGMRWSLCDGNDFPYWIELHIQSVFEMKLEQEKEAFESKRATDTKDASFSEDKGMLSSNVGKNKKGGKKNKANAYYDLQEDDAEYEEEEDDQPVPRNQRINNKNGNNKYANMEDEDEEAGYYD